LLAYRLLTVNVMRNQVMNCVYQKFMHKSFRITDSAALVASTKVTFYVRDSRELRSCSYVTKDDTAS